MAGANEFPNVSEGDDGMETDDVIVEIEGAMGESDVASASRHEEGDVILETIAKKVIESGDSKERFTTIDKVPEGHGYGDRDVYEPSIISIGPYHRGKPTLQPMEMLKLKCFERLKKRSSIRSMESCIHELGTVEMEARSHYSASTEELLSRDFVEMMFLDACFILEYCTCVRDGTLSDLVNDKIWMDTAIRNDLLLLENQLPFFVVKLTAVILTSQSPEQLMDLVQCFCKNVSPINSYKCLGDEHPMDLSKKNEHPMELSKKKEHRMDHLLAQHLLHIYHWFLFSSTNHNISRDRTTNLFRPEKPICTIRSATFLRESGIMLSRKMHMTDTVLDANFRDGVMYITPLFIDAFSVSQFRNLIAFEKSDPYIEPLAIAFSQFMDYIISTSKDVELLQMKGIIEHALGGNEEIANIFDQLTSGTRAYRTSELARMYKDVDEYCKTRRHRWWAILVRDYFGTPWAAISLVAGVILLSLGFLRVFLYWYSYFRTRSAKGM